MPIRLSGINSGLDTDAIVKELVSAYSLKTEKYEKQQTKLEWKQDAWKGLNTKIYGFYTNMSNLRFESAYNLKKTTLSDSSKATVTAASGAVTGTQKLNVLQTAQASYITGGYIGEEVTASSTLKDLGYTGGNTSIKVRDSEGKDTVIEINAETKISDLISKFKDAGINANFDSNNNRIFLSAKESGAAGDFDLVAENSEAYSVLSTLGLASKEDAVEELKRQANEYNKLYAENESLKAVVDPDDETKARLEELKEKLGSFGADVRAVAAGKKAEDVVNDENLATKITGQDAIIKLNGVQFTSSTNTFQVNGLTIEAQALTGEKDEDAVTINTTVDTQGIYDKIKDFFTEYNNVINEITKLYNAESAKDYEPLTDEEKDSMSDEQIEKWEDKIKSALLRRDNSLGNVMNAMVNSMSQSYEIDGQKLSLSNFGISTLGFLNAAENEQYAFHIDGDEDDENTSGKKDKLMAAIQENPDQIMKFMQKLTSNLYTAIDDKMKSTELSSAYKVYNDKEMDKEAKEIENLIKKWNDKIAEQEDAYFKKFSQMEVALSKLQSQTNSLSGLLGQ